MIDPNSEAVKDFQSTCESITKLSSDVDNIVSRQQWGEIDFNAIRGDIETAFWLAEELRGSPVHLLPDTVFGEAAAHLSQMRQLFDQINKFRISEGDAVALRDSISTQFQQLVEAAMSVIGVWLPLLALRAGEIENWSIRAKEISADMTKMMQDAGDRIDEGMKDIRSSVNAAKAAAGEAGAAEFTHEFRRESEIVEKRAKIWLWPTAILALIALTLSFLFSFGIFSGSTQTVWDAVYGLGGRVIAISVLFYASVWSGRIVLANMHLANVNKHRAVSLQTLQAFRQAVEDTSTKDAVVLEAARAIYENVPSGYIGRQSADQNTGSRTVEFIRGIGKTAKSGDSD